MTTVSSGVVSSGLIVSSGSSVSVGSGGTTIGTTILAGGSETIVTGGHADGSLVSSGGTQVVWGGLASSTTVVVGGTEFLSGFGSAVNTLVNGGNEIVGPGGTLSGTVVGNGGIDYVYGSATGSLVASGGAEYVLAGGALSGGTLSGGLIEIGRDGSAGTVGFTSAGGILQLDDSVHFGGTISGFGVPGDIDLRDIAFGSGTTLGYSGNASSGTLTVSDGTHSASINLLGQYTAGNFATHEDGAGGTLVTDPPLANLALPTGAPHS